MIRPEDVTIIIPHLGGTSESEYAMNACVNSIIETSNSPFILAKNGDRCLDRHFLKNRIVIIAQGQCKAVNAAVATTNTPWIFITNDDMIYPPGWFERLIDWHIHGMPREPICLSPKLIEPRPGAPTFEVQPFGGAGGDFDKEAWLQYAEKYANGIGLRTGFNLPLLISRELWDTIGGYDINYDPWGSNSDSDLEYKIKLAGIQPFQNTNCIVYHFSQTSGTFSPEHQDAWQRNLDYFTKKWGFPRTSDNIWEATFSIPDEGRIFRPQWEGKYA